MTGTEDENPLDYRDGPHGEGPETPGVSGRSAGVRGRTGRVGTEKVVDEETVSDQVRQEHIEVEGDVDDPSRRA